MAMIDKQEFLAGDRQCELYHLTCDSGLSAWITNYGARLVALEVPREDGLPVDVVLGYRTLEAYRADRAYHGAIVGRYANRIAGGRFVLGGREHHLDRNEGTTTLHGGPSGFSSRVWQGEQTGHRTLRLELQSPDGDGGFPGNLRVSATYTLEPAGALRVDYAATTDADTVVNLTSHAYFNLAGEGAGPVDDHVLTIEAAAILPVDSTLIPSGDELHVGGTPFDFRHPRRIGDGLQMAHPQLAVAGGYDHNFVLDGGKSETPRQVARLECGTSGIAMEILTTEPGLQFYSGHQLQDRQAGKRGNPYGARSGLCLETQHFPDSPNRAAFPSTVLRAGEQFRSASRLRFGRAS
jgi:aldose 1-epimerase